MRGNELLDKMELIDSVYVEAADAMPKRRRAAWLRWCAGMPLPFGHCGDRACPEG